WFLQIISATAPVFFSAAVPHLLISFCNALSAFLHLHLCLFPFLGFCNLFLQPPLFIFISLLSYLIGLNMCHFDTIVCHFDTLVLVSASISAYVSASVPFFSAQTTARSSARIPAHGFCKLAHFLFAPHPRTASESLTIQTL